MLVISITNQKGGVGKTTTTYHLARAASRRNLRTLVIDLDPQGNLSDSLTELEEKQAGMADVLSASSSYCLDEVVVETAWNGVYLAPSGGLHPALAAKCDWRRLCGDSTGHRSIWC